MWRNSSGCFILFLFAIVSRGGAETLSSTDRDNLFHENDLVSFTKSDGSSLPVTPTIDYADTARSCLYVSPDLPPCAFNRDDDSQRYRRSLDVFNEGIKFDEKYTVYAIQGCLPPRLPFRMALCESKESLERATRIWKLYPFRGTAEERKRSFVFPRFDFDRWTRAMKLLEEEQRGGRNAEKTSGGKDDRENSFLPSREYVPGSIIRGDEVEEGSAVSSAVVVARNHSTRSNSGRITSERRGRRRRGSKRRRRRSVRSEGSSQSIPFDPKRSSKFLREASGPFLLSRWSRDIQIGSEFPYWKAIPYDPKKFEVERNAAGNNRARKILGLL